MLQVSNLRKSYGARTLFDNVTFSLVAGERVGLVGRNGCGKSTLFKLILGEEHPDEGSISFPRGYKVGHLAQHLKFTEENILDEACLGLPEGEDDQTYKAEIILGGLGFTEQDFAKAPASFSGGYQIRLNLAKLLLSQPNLLLLDEPTNYLDIVSLRWLSTVLRQWEGELIIISHDRLFMDQITTHSMIVHRGNVRKMPGDTRKLYAQIALDEEIYEKTRVNEDKKRKDLEEFIARFRAQASKAALVQSRMKALEKMGQREELADEASLDFQFSEAPHPGKVCLECSNVTFGYPEGPTLIRDLTFSIGRTDRIGVIGKNGRGKSTLLRLLAQELAPVKGEVIPGANARVGYFGQTNISRLDPTLTVEEEIARCNNTFNRTKVRAICGTVMFSGDDALKKISVLSGGEKSRVLLGKLLAQPSNLLLLDEPTNHLDMESIEALIESLKTYQGAVVIVTHSELILKELATRLILFQGDAPTVFEHGYDFFLEKHGWQADEPQMPTRHHKDAPPPTAGKQRDRLEKKIRRTEATISTLEAEVAKLEAEMIAAYEAGDIDLGTALTEQLTERQLLVEKEYEELAALSGQLEQLGT